MAATDRKGRHRHDDYIIYNQPGNWDSLMLIGRGLLHRAEGLRDAGGLDDSQDREDLVIKSGRVE